MGLRSGQNGNKRALKFLVQGRAEMNFYQVIFVLAEGVEPAVQAIKRFLNADNAFFVVVDDEETEEVEVQSIPPEMVLPRPTPEGIIAFGGRIWFPELEQ
jgi:hypothetical protein